MNHRYKLYRGGYEEIYTKYNKRTLSLLCRRKRKNEFRGKIF